MNAMIFLLTLKEIHSSIPLKIFHTLNIAIISRSIISKSFLRHNRIFKMLPKRKRNNQTRFLFQPPPSSVTPGGRPQFVRTHGGMKWETRDGEREKGLR
eukprot:UN03171